MPPNNRRRGPSNRPPHLRPAPVPPADPTPEQEITAPPVGEDAPWAPSQQVTVTLPQHEYVALRDRADGDSRPPSALLGVPALREREQADDKDAPFEPARTQPAATQQLADVKLADQERQAAHATGSSCDHDSASLANADEDTADDDRDPFEELALASTPAPTRSLAAPGSAAIDTPPIRPARRRTRRTTSSANHSSRPERDAAGRRLGRRSLIAGVLILAVVAAFAIILERPTRTVATSPRVAASSAPEPALTTLAQVLATNAPAIGASVSKTAAKPKTVLRQHRRTRHPQIHRARARSRPASQATATAAAARFSQGPSSQATSSATSGSTATPVQQTSAQQTSIQQTPVQQAPAQQPSTPRSQPPAQPAGPTSLGGQVGNNCNPKCR